MPKLSVSKYPSKNGIKISKGKLIPAPNNKVIKTIRGGSGKISFLYT